MTLPSDEGASFHVTDRSSHIVRRVSTNVPPYVGSSFVAYRRSIALVTCPRGTSAASNLSRKSCMCIWPVVSSRSSSFTPKFESGAPRAIVASSVGNSSATCPPDVESGTNSSSVKAISGECDLPSLLLYATLSLWFPNIQIVSGRLSDTAAVMSSSYQFPSSTFSSVPRLAPSHGGAVSNVTASSSQSESVTVKNVPPDGDESVAYSRSFASLRADIETRERSNRR
mmetsp:Transcript_12386/g.30271  ORF Transcript_12386/g.30271 Transcript_12386/m.30271 type:complete len:227 (-) Transcript_12386:204-884(-)